MDRLTNSELERLADEAHRDAEAAMHFPRWVVIGFWSVVAFELAVIAWVLL